MVIVSGFDMIRREVARLALNKLIADGRIHPARIEEIVVATQKELEKHIQKLGEDACQELAIHGLHERLISLLGRLHFRTSYSQNVLRHCVEVAFIAGMMAEEVGLDGALARRCGLLHDIGKAADHEAEGGHPKIGADLLKRYGERPEVVHAACGHHDDLRICNPYTVLVAAADACSAARPGARRESLERYVKRMEELERIAGGFTGVEQAYAIQAGRELRVLVNSKETTDEIAAKICHDIVQAFEKQLTYPGEIKVTVVRETQARGSGQIKSQITKSEYRNPKQMTKIQKEQIQNACGFSPFVIFCSEFVQDFDFGFRFFLPIPLPHASAFHRRHRRQAGPADLHAGPAGTAAGAGASI